MSVRAQGTGSGGGDVERADARARVMPREAQVAGRERAGGRAGGRADAHVRAAEGGLSGGSADVCSLVFGAAARPPACPLGWCAARTRLACGMVHRRNAERHATCPHPGPVCGGSRGHARVSCARGLGSLFECLAREAEKLKSRAPRTGCGRRCACGPGDLMTRQTREHENDATHAQERTLTHESRRERSLARRRAHRAATAGRGRPQECHEALEMINRRSEAS